MIRILSFALLFVASQALGQNVQTVVVKNSVKRGNCLTVAVHDGYEKDAIYSVFLYRNGQKGQLLDERNVRSLIGIGIPKEIKAGKGYQLAFVRGDEILFTNTFTVKRKVALAWYALPVAAIISLLVLDHQNDGVGEMMVDPPGSVLN